MVKESRNRLFFMSYPFLGGMVSPSVSLGSGGRTAEVLPMNNWDENPGRLGHIGSSSIFKFLLQLWDSQLGGATVRTVAVNHQSQLCGLCSIHPSPLGCVPNKWNQMTDTEETGSNVFSSHSQNAWSLISLCTPIAHFQAVEADISHKGSFSWTILLERLAQGSWK